jgi:hypothetical protein
VWVWGVGGRAQLVNKFVPLPIKAFAKRVACAPETISAYEFGAFSTAFTHAERVHVVLLVAEARRQAALLYGLAAVVAHMAGRY